jgi:hypothetical protein
MPGARCRQDAASGRGGQRKREEQQEEGVLG